MSGVGTHRLRQIQTVFIVGDYMVFRNTKEKGRAGLSAAIAYFGMNGYTVSIPINDIQDYDLVVEMNNVFYKVQCKSTGAKNDSGNYKVKLETWGGLNGGTRYSRVKDSTVQLLFVLTGEQTMYVIPVSEITQSTQLILNNNYDKYKVVF